VPVHWPCFPVSAGWHGRLKPEACSISEALSSPNSILTEERWPLHWARYLDCERAADLARLPVDRQGPAPAEPAPAHKKPPPRVRETAGAVPGMRFSSPRGGIDRCVAGLEDGRRNGLLGQREPEPRAIRKEFPPGGAMCSFGVPATDIRKSRGTPDGKLGPK
jgi:hypothetical protein